LGKIKKKETQKVEVTSRGESEMKDVLSCNFQTFGFLVFFSVGLSCPIVNQQFWRRPHFFFWLVHLLFLGDGD
jgi:hypothetical protein